MPSTDETQQMIEDEIAPITAQLDQLDYELDSRIDSLQTRRSMDCPPAPAPELANLC